ncbi:MAG: LLM class flavin-dependent oxidoreductase [Thermomicrobiales bacterium]
MAERSTALMPPPDELDFGVVTGQHWRNWETIRKQWLWAEDSGWDSAWVFDHFWSLRPTHDGDTLEGWTLLAALAVETSRLKMGTLVTGITHRLPAVLFKQAVTVDHISNGRANPWRRCGLGGRGARRSRDPISGSRGSGRHVHRGDGDQSDVRDSGADDLRG